jgi:hypothetical protein
MLAGHLHVKRYGVRIGVDLENTPLSSVLVDVEGDVDGTGFVRLDK